MKNESIFKRAHQIAKVLKSYQYPNTAYSTIFANALRKAYHEDKMAIRRYAIVSRLKNEFGYTESKAWDRVISMSDYQVNLQFSGQ